ncbi:MAG: HAMP domain-containing protein [Armatimonadetes bacterium]|nr:HAMP domain-containing protein [Armatimonadota bacterium]
MRSLSLRYRLALTYTLLIFLAVTVLGVRVLSAVKQYYLESIREATAEHTRLVARLLSQSLDRAGPPADLKSLCDALGKQVGAQVTLLGAGGVALADSQSNGSSGVHRAGRQERACAVCHEEERKVESVHSVEPVRVAGSPVREVQLTVPSLTVARALSKIRRMAIDTMIVTMLLAGWLSFRIATSLSRPVARMEKMARRVADGDLEQHLTVTSSDEVGRLAESLNLMTRRLREMVQRLKKERDACEVFAADVSHQLRTPVTALRATCEALLVGGIHDPAVATEFLQTLERQSRHLSALLDDILSIARLDTGVERYSRAPVEVNEVLHDVARLMEPVAAEKQVRFEVAPGPPAVVNANCQQLEQVLANLLDNAVKYSPVGESVVLGAEREDEWIRVFVEDHGSGIPPADLARIFERFYRSSDPHTRHLAGTGLGLSIVKEIIEAYGGQVFVESTVGVGSRFSFILPTGAITLENGDTHAAPDEVRKPVVSGGADGAPACPK